MQNNSSKIYDLSSTSSTPQITPMLPKNPPPSLPSSIVNQMNLIDTHPFITSATSSSMRNITDTKDDETFYEKIKYMNFDYFFSIIIYMSIYPLENV